MITFFTIVLDGMPWIGEHYHAFRRLYSNWRWIVVEGVAANVNCTSWCAKIESRLSSDGTTEYLRHLCSKDHRITHITKPLWPGKVAMCNAALELIREPCLLWQVDADEVWTADQIDSTRTLFGQYLDQNCAYFRCRYFVGADRYIVPNHDTYGNHTSFEWLRVWRFQPGMRFESHEPPKLANFHPNPIPHHVTQGEGLVFDHFAYSARKQMEFRAQYYAGQSNPNAHLWRGCVEGWERLQAVTKFPVKLKDYFPWVDDNAQVVHV